MQVTHAFLCHNAKLQDGQVISASPQLSKFTVTQIPSVVMPICIVFAIAFPEGSAGQHKITIYYINADGRDALPGVDPKEFPFEVPKSESGNIQSVLELHGLPLPGLGDFRMDIYIDGQHSGEIPFEVVMDE